MDKFGIFNILNNLLGSKSATDGSAPEKTTDVNNLLGSLFTPKKQTEQPAKGHSAPPVPLQSSMISTMNGHDEFIKRVMSKNKKIKDKR